MNFVGCHCQKGMKKVFPSAASCRHAFPKYVNLVIAFVYKSHSGAQLSLLIQDHFSLQTLSSSILSSKRELEEKNES